MMMDMRHSTATDGRQINGPLCQVSLIDRRTGNPLRLNGAVVTVQTRQPHQAARELLEGRDASIWQLRISPLETRARK